MYLKKEFLLKCLLDSGYSKIDCIYVSNEFGKRKDKGDLFDYILENEKIEPDELLHIGDNYHSDFAVPLSKGIVSYLYPSISSMVKRENTLWSNVANVNDPFLRIILGYVLNTNSSYFIDRKSARMYKSCSDFGTFLLGCLLTAFCLFVQNNEYINNNYKEIGFASRDGYLPYKAYSAFSDITNFGLPSFYFESGRLLYYTLYNDTFEKFIKPDKNFAQDITLNEYISRVIVDSDLKNVILNSLSIEDKEITVANSNKWKHILSRFKMDINQYIQRNNKRLIAYYNNLFKEDKNLIFDCGYSGSIALALNKATGRRCDKLYLWHDEESIERDRVYGTNTISFFGLLQKYIQNINIHIIIEEVFSPVNRRPIKIDDNLNPIFSDEIASYEMKNDIERMHKSALDTVMSFGSYFKELTRYFKISNPGEILKSFEAAFSTSPYVEYDLFRNIVYEDFASKSTISLASKVEKSPIYNQCKLLGCGLVNPDLILSHLKPSLSSKLKMGVHVHVYNEALIYETIHYLSNLPANSGVYITTPKKHIVNTFKILLDSLLPNLNSKVILTENRGRDVAPLLIGIGAIQNDYDIFCHLHCKQSKWTNDNGESWRKYLFDNLLSKDAIFYTERAFLENLKLGVLSPLPYNPILDIHGLMGVDVFGDIRSLMSDLFSKAYPNIKKEFIRADLAFSIGTMFWYRPRILNKILSSNITYNDFPSEPIGIDGTIAHAFEKILKVLCEKEGFTFRYMSKKF